MTKKPKSRKKKHADGWRSKSSSPQKSLAQPPPSMYVEPSCPQTVPQTYAQTHTVPHISEFITTPAQVETPTIVQAAKQDSSSQPPLYLLHPDADLPIELPPWVAEFRPRIPPLNGSREWDSPIPRCKSITHAILVREALTKFHLAVYLADEDAGESENRFRQNLAQICTQYMPAMMTLGIKRHQIVFFYHGRKQIRMGNSLWDAIEDWRNEYWRSRPVAFESRYT